MYITQGCTSQEVSRRLSSCSAERQISGLAAFVCTVHSPALNIYTKKSSDLTFGSETQANQNVLSNFLLVNK